MWNDVPPGICFKINQWREVDSKWVYRCNKIGYVLIIIGIG